MKYTFKTYSHGLRGADAAVFADGVHVWSSQIVQTCGEGDTDRARAARCAREHIFELKQLGWAAKRTQFAVGTWVITPAQTLRGVVSHVYHDNVTAQGRLVQVDINCLPGEARITQVNVREANLRIAKNQTPGWVA